MIFIKLKHVISHDRRVTAQVRKKRVVDMDITIITARYGCSTLVLQVEIPNTHFLLHCKVKDGCVLRYKQQRQLIWDSIDVKLTLNRYQN